MARIAQHTSEETKRTIQDAFVTLYQTQGLERITVSKISKQANINRGTFYRYYLDVSDLLEQMEDDYIKQISTLLPILIHGMLHNDLIDHMEPLVQFYSANRDVLLLFFVTRPNYRILSNMKETAKQYALAEFQLEEAQLTTKQHCLFEYICNAQIGLIGWWLEHGTAQDLPLLAQTMVDANTKGPLQTILLGL